MSGAAAPIFASRMRPGTLVPAARAMYERGMSRSEVLTAIYGVDLPREAVLIERDYVAGNKPIRVRFNAHPWELMIPLDRGGPKFMIGPLGGEDDARALAQAPNVLLVAWLRYARVKNGFSVIGYDLDELRAGRSTVVGLPPEHKQVPTSGARFEVFGPSLLDVFANVITAYRASWDGDYTREAAEEQKEASAELAGIEALRVELASTP